MKNFGSVPFGVKLLLCAIAPFILVGIGSYIVENYSLSEVLGVTAFVTLIISMSQDDIIKLRLWGACAGICFVVQFSLSDLPFINVLGQLGLVIYGIYKAVEEIEQKKDIV